MGACRAVPQISYLTQVLRQVVLVVSLSGQLQVVTEWVQPHWISPAEANGCISSTKRSRSIMGYKKNLFLIFGTELLFQLFYEMYFMGSKI